MAVVVDVVVPLGTRAAFDGLESKVSAAMERSGGPPEGLMSHVVHPAGDGFVISQVWRTEGAFRAYYDESLRDLLLESGSAPQEPVVSAVWSFARP